MLEKLNDLLESDEKVLLNKAINTLKTNVIEKTADYAFADRVAVAPSPATYKGVWNWDAAFHHVAFCYFEPETGKDQIRILFDYMSENGQLPDVVFSNGKVVDKFTKPPVIAHAIRLGDMIAPDIQFLEYAYPYLERNLKWWENNRYDGTLFGYKVHKMESGWDNTPRFDFPHKIYNCYAIDCNCFMYSFYDAMAYISDRLNNNRSEYYRNKAKELADKINTLLFDKTNQCYCDYNFKLKKFTKRLSPASFLPLFFNIANEKQAVAMRKIALDKNKFYDTVPTIAFDCRAYSPSNYWRGPCWLNTAYFLVKGLHNYGYKQQSLTITEKILSMCKQNDIIYEYYNSKTGEGLGAKNFGWSSAFIIEFLLLKYNLTIDL